MERLSFKSIAIALQGCTYGELYGAREAARAAICVEALRIAMAHLSKTGAERDLLQAREEVKKAWRLARDAHGQTEAFRILEAMVDRVGYGRDVSCDKTGG